MFGYCNTCLQPLLTKDFKVIKGKKICLNCLSGQEKNTTDIKETARQNDIEKEGLFTFLLSLFPVGKPPLSWGNSIDIMNKKGFSCHGIISTLKYCIMSGKRVDIDNWSSLIYVYYPEAQVYEEQCRKIQEINTSKEFKKVVDTVRIRNTTYRDLPPYDIKDL